MNDQDLQIRVTCEAREIEFGRAFPLTVERSWNKSLQPEEWSDMSLAPLTVRRLGSSRREEGDVVTESIELECRAFSLEDISIPTISFRATKASGGPAHEVDAAGFDLVVTPAVDREAAGSAELPGGLLLEPEPSLLPWVVGAALLVTVMLWALLRKLPRAAPAAEPSPETLSPFERALRRLAALKTLRTHSHTEVASFHVEASGLVRDYLEEALDLRAPRMSTEQLASLAHTALSSPLQRELTSFLSRCDRVKFADHAATGDEVRQVLTTTEQLVTTLPARTPTSRDL